MTFNFNGHPFDLYKDECRVLMEHKSKKSCSKQKVTTVSTKTRKWNSAVVPTRFLLPLGDDADHDIDD